MKNLILIFLACTTMLVAGCSKPTELTAKNEHFQWEEKINALVDNCDDLSMPMQDEAATFTLEQIRTIADEVADYWTYDEVHYAITSKDSWQCKYDFLSSKLPNNNRDEDPGALETFCKRPSGYFVDSSPQLLAQVLAASGMTVGTKSSLNLFRPINDTGVVSAMDISFATSRITPSLADTFIELDTSSVVFEFAVSGQNWLIAADIIYRPAPGIEEVIHYGFDSPNGPLIFNPSLASPAPDYVIEGPMPMGVGSISANGINPPAFPQ